MSSERTGYALGRLNPIVYYENSAGYLILAPSTATARYYLEVKNASGSSLADRGFMLREAGTLPEVYELQDRLVKQEQAKGRADAERDERMTEARWKAVGERLFARMHDSKTPAMEAEVIRVWLSQRDDRRRRHLAKWSEYTSYLWAAEMDSGTKGTDRMKSEPGDRWEHGE